MGGLLLLVAAAAFAAALDSAVVADTKAWAVLASVALATVGVLLVAATLAFRGSRTASIVLAATPGMTLATICYVCDRYFVRWDSPGRTALSFGLAFGMYFGLLWGAVGSIITTRVKALRRHRRTASSNGSAVGRPVAAPPASSRGAILATLFAGLCAIVGPVVAVLIEMANRR